MELKDRLAIKWYSMADVLDFLPKPPKGAAKKFEEYVKTVALASGCCAQFGDELYFTEDHVRGLVDALRPQAPPPSPAPPQAAATVDEIAPGWLIFLTLPEMGPSSNVLFMWAPHGAVEARIKSATEDLGYVVASIGAGSHSDYNKWRSKLRHRALGGVRYAPCELLTAMMDVVVDPPEKRRDPEDVDDERNC